MIVRYAELSVARGKMAGMSVKVHVITPNGHKDDHDHQAGEQITVEDGHLIVHGELNGRTRSAVAIYAPKAWYRAEVQ